MDEMDRRAFLIRAGAAAAATTVFGAGLMTRPRSATALTGPLGALDAVTRGPILVPGTSAYNVAQPGFNLAYAAKKPLGILQPVNALDVVQAIKWSDARNIRIAARSGGHSYAGYSTPSKGLLVDLRRMRSITRLANGNVRVGAGAQLIDVHTFLTSRGLVLPTGSCPSVGVSGLTLGGGYGLSSRRYGLLCDRLRAVEIVTADGVRRRVSATHEPDLFWALRGGGGGNFGIATAFEFSPARATHAAWFMMRWPWSQAEEVLGAFLRFVPGADRRLTALCTLSTGGSGVTVLGQFYGGESTLRTLLLPLRRVPGASLSTGTASTMDLVRRWAGCLDKSVLACHTRGTRTGGTMPRERFAAASGYLDVVPGATGLRRITKLIEQRRAQGAGGALIIDAYGGAIRDISPGATAFVHRRELASVQAYTGYGAGQGPLAQTWLASVRTVLGSVGSGFAYQNYIDPKQTGWARAYYGANLARLRQVRQTYDPSGLFTFAQAISQT